MRRVQHSTWAPWVALGLALLAVGGRAHAQGDGGMAVEREVRRTQEGLAVEPGLGAADGGVPVDGGLAELVPPSLLEDSLARYPAELEAEPVVGTVRLELLVD